MSAQVFKSREGFDSNKRRIINVADGIDSLDAVNVQQMLEQIAQLTAGRIVPYSEAAGYAEGSLVLYENKLYYTDTFIAKPAGAFNSNIWIYVGYDIDDIDNAGAADTLYSSLRINQLLDALTAAEVDYSNNTNIPNNPSNVQLAIEEIHKNLTAIQSGVRYLGVLQISTVPVAPQTGDYYFAGYDGTNVNINGGIDPFVEGNTIIYNGTDWDIISQNVGVVDIDGESGTISGKLVRTDNLGGALTVQTIATGIQMSNQLIQQVANPVDAQDAATKDYVDTSISAGGVVTGPVSILSATDTGSGDPLSLTTNVHGEATGINTLNGNVTIEVYVERDNTGGFAPANVRYSINDGTVNNIAANLLVPAADKPGFTYDLVLAGLADTDTVQLYNGDTKFETTISIVSQIIITSVVFDDNAGPGDIYPSGQTAVKVGDTVNVTATSASQFTSMTVSEICDSVTESFPATASYTMSVTVSASDNAAENASVVITDANGDSPLVQSSNTIVVSSVVPTVSISGITYPASQNAIKSTEAATLTIAHSNAVSMSAVSATSELSIPAIPSPTNSLVVTRQSGGYNVNTENISITVTAANGNTAVDGDIVKIADSAPSLFISGGTPKLRSAGDLSEQETITITSDQQLRTALTIDLTRPDAGTSSGITNTGFTTTDTTVDFVITVDEAWGKGSVVGALVTNTAGENLAGVAASIGATNIDFNGFYPKLVVIVGPNNPPGTYAPLDLEVKVVDTSDLSATYRRVNPSTPNPAPYSYDPSVTSNTDPGVEGPIGYGIIPGGGLNDDQIVIDYDSVVFFGGDNVEINIEEL
jgi:hypothetical protein